MIAFEPPKSCCFSVVSGYQQPSSKPTINRVGSLTRLLTKTAARSLLCAVYSLIIPTFAYAQSPIFPSSIIGGITGSQNGYHWATIYDDSRKNALTVACHPEKSLTAFLILDQVSINEISDRSNFNDIPLRNVEWATTAEGQRIISDNLILSNEGFLNDLENSDSIDLTSEAFSTEFTDVGLLRSFLSRECGFTVMPSMPWKIHDLGYENTVTHSSPLGVDGKLYISGSDIFLTFEDENGQDALNLGQQASTTLLYRLDRGQTETVGADILPTTTWPQRRAYRIRLTEDITQHETLEISFTLNGSQHEYHWALRPWPHELYRTLSSGGQ